MIKLDVEQMLPALTIAGSIAKEKGNPILGNVLITNTGTGLAVTVTDHEIELQQTVELYDDGLTFNECEPFLVSARGLLEICKTLPKESSLTIDVQKDAAPKKVTSEKNFTINEIVPDGKVTIKTGRSKFVLSSLPIDDFPIMQNPSIEFTKEIDAQDLCDMLNKVSLFVAVNDSRYFLNGMLMEFETTKLNLIATDGHRLAFTHIPQTPPIATGFSKIIPRTTVLLLAKMLAKRTGMVKFETGIGFCRFGFDGVTITTKLIDGKFPDYQRVTPKNLKNIALVDREEFANAITQTMVAKTEKYHGVTLSFTDTQLDINTPQKESIKIDVETSLGINYKGTPIDIGFNTTYLLDVLKTMTCDTVEIKLADHISSILLTEPEMMDTYYVIMPMRM
jgi:DNA polymerase III subunit beta